MDHDSAAAAAESVGPIPSPEALPGPQGKEGLVGPEIPEPPGGMVCKAAGGLGRLSLPEVVAPPIHGKEPHQRGGLRQLCGRGQHYRPVLHPGQQPRLGKDQHQIPGLGRGGGEGILIDVGGNILNHSAASRKKASMAARSARTEPWTNSGFPPPRPWRAWFRALVKSRRLPPGWAMA